MREIWRETKMVNRRFVPSDTPLDQVAANPVFENAVNPLLDNENERKEVAEVFQNLSDRYKDISELRQVLIQNPQKLGLEPNQTKFLLALFISKLDAGRY